MRLYVMDSRPRTVPHSIDTNIEWIHTYYTAHTTKSQMVSFLTAAAAHILITF